MKESSAALRFTLIFSKAYTVVNRKFDSMLSVHGLSFSDFMVLYHLRHSNEQKLRRIDLAEQMGVTASGITRMLLPMEKTGWVARESSERDARISYVVLAPGGERLLSEALKTAEYAAAELFPQPKMKKLELLAELLPG